MHSAANKITNSLINNGIIQSNRREEYEYGFEVFGLKCVNYGTILLLAIFFHMLIPTIFFMMCFITLRGRTGGYHTHSAFVCYLGTVSIYVLMSQTIISVIFDTYVIWAVIMIFSSIMIFLLAPLNSESVELSKNEMTDCRRAVRILLLLFVASTGVAMFIGVNTVCIAYAVSGVALDAILLIIGNIVCKCRTVCSSADNHVTDI